MKGAGFCSLNREVHYIVWSLNRVLGVLENLSSFNQVFFPRCMHFFSQKYAIFLKNMQFFSKICNFSQKCAIFSQKYAIFSKKICIGKCLKFSYTYKKNAMLMVCTFRAMDSNK